MTRFGAPPRRPSPVLVRFRRAIRAARYLPKHKGVKFSAAQVLAYPRTYVPSDYSEAKPRRLARSEATVAGGPGLLADTRGSARRIWHSRQYWDRVWWEHAEAAAR